MGSSEDFEKWIFPVQEVHMIAVLDIRLANADRHLGNMLVREEERGCMFLYLLITDTACLRM